MLTKWNLYTLLVKTKNGTLTLENSLAISYEVKHILTIRPINTILSYLPKKNKNS